MTFNIAWEKSNGLYWEYYGNISGVDVLKASMLAYGDMRFEELKYKLVNFLNIKSIDMTEDEAFAIAERHKAAEMYNSNIKNAIVVNSKTSKLANKFAESFSNSRWDVRVFHTLDEANDWLGRKVPI